MNTTNRLMVMTTFAIINIVSLTQNNQLIEPQFDVSLPNITDETYMLESKTKILFYFYNGGESI